MAKHFSFREGFLPHLLDALKARHRFTGDRLLGIVYKQKTKQPWVLCVSLQIDSKKNTTHHLEGCLFGRSSLLNTPFLLFASTKLDAVVFYVFSLSCVGSKRFLSQFTVGFSLYVPIFCYPGTFFECQVISVPKVCPCREIEEALMHVTVFPHIENNSLASQSLFHIIGTCFVFLLLRLN